MRTDASRLARSAALAAIGLDVAYTRATGCRLWYDPSGVGLGPDRPVWDFVGGYGSTFFGHNHPDLKRVIRAFLDRDGVVHGQCSRRSASDRLRSVLRGRLRTALRREYELVLANTGAEAVEVAAKHAALAWSKRREELIARLQLSAMAVRSPGTQPEASGSGLPARGPSWSRTARETLGRLDLLRSGGTLQQIRAHNERVLRPEPGFLALSGAFHGMTERALALTDDPSGHFRAGIRGPPRVRFIDRYSAEALEETLAQWTEPVVRVLSGSDGWSVETVPWTQVAAFFIEPIQGEGGIHPLEPAVVRSWSASCSTHGVPIVADEIQTGMGRTGTFLYCERLGIAPDYVVLGKSLGGGLVKISAVAVSEEQFCSDFSIRHASTFGEDDLSSSVALRALELLDEEHALVRAERTGRRLLSELSALAGRFPGVIREVRGCGLMIGIEWRGMGFEKSNVLRYLRDYGWLGYAVSAYLLRKHSVRVAPGLSRSTVIRIEPDYALPEEAVISLVAALEDLCSVLERQDSGALLGPSLARRTPSLVRGIQAPDRETSRGFPTRSFARHPVRGTHVAFIGHFVDEESVGLWDPGLGRLGPDLCREFLERVRPLAEPLLCHREAVGSIRGEETTLSFIGIPVSSRQCHEAIHVPDDRRELRGLIQRAVDMAAREGCSVVGLGGYCSILTRNGKGLSPRGTVLTTGNGFTVGSGLLALRDAARSGGIELADARAVVVGALGNIGSVIAETLAREVRSLVLVGRNGRRSHLEATAARIREEGVRASIEIETSTSACRAAQLIVAASNAAGALISADDLGHHPAIVVDLAVPPDVDRSVIEGRSKLRLVRGGVVRTPCNPDWWVPGIGLQPGEMFACMAETVLMGLDRATPDDHDPDPGSLGSLTVERVLATVELAHRHGFGTIADVDPINRQPASRTVDMSSPEWPPAPPAPGPWPRSTA